VSTINATATLIPTIAGVEILDPLDEALEEAAAADDVTDDADAAVCV